MAPAGTLTTRRELRHRKTAIKYAEEENSDSEPESPAHEVETIKRRRIEEDVIAILSFTAARLMADIFLGYRVLSREMEGL
ncbi:uncharacterized protein FFNC_15404 [Fusarium fujikuroi]|nr:uncharacterized protein FFNC_15404 [Fusarium fujikuroi]